MNYYCTENIKGQTRGFEVVADNERALTAAIAAARRSVLADVLIYRENENEPFTSFDAIMGVSPELGYSPNNLKLICRRRLISFDDLAEGISDDDFKVKVKQIKRWARDEFHDDRSRPMPYWIWLRVLAWVDALGSGESEPEPWESESGE